MTTKSIPPILRLPVELRLRIYEFVLQQTHIVTVGTAELVGAHHDIVHRLYGGTRAPLPGIPRNHVPVVSPSYNASLLSITDQATVPASQRISEVEEHARTHTAPLSLLLVNKQFNDELTSHFSLKGTRKTSLFLSLHGLTVIKALAPHLLRQARSVHLAGSYIPTTFDPTRAACVGPREPLLDQKEVRYHGDFIPDFTSDLGNLIATCFGSTPKHTIEVLEMRIYYPGLNSYPTVWSDDDSPVVVALRNVCAAEVGIEVWRGRYGTGVYLSVRSNKKERRRDVSTVWRRLEEGSSGQPACGSFVIDEKWPAWEATGHTIASGS